MYRRILIITFAIIGLCAILTFLPIHGENQIYDNVIRLHVLANSDTQVDQTLKLQVRDAVLKEMSHLFEKCKTQEEACNVTLENIEMIRGIAKKTIRDSGYDYSVDVKLGEENYPTRNYQNFCFPSGEYTSLRIIIGNGEGQNWWCVLFPPMCLGAASDEEACAEVGISDEQYHVITETDNVKYKVRFKILEAFEAAIN